MGNILLVSKISDTTAETLRKTFSEAGTVTEVDVVIDRDTGQPRGFAYVTMSSSAEAAAAITKFNWYELDGRAITVSDAPPRSSSDRSGRGGRRH